uniref:Uncharacterized protein n=1 Tax=Anguilla anguilla TaxID=7936 RepID=A0A0E9VXI0_ANGAN
MHLDSGTDLTVTLQASSGVCRAVLGVL